MKIVTIIGLTFGIICPISIYGWGVFAGIYYNPTTKHTVGFLGDRHDPRRVNIQQEQKFIDISLPFIRDLITNRYPNIAFLVEINYEGLQHILIKIKDRNYISLTLLDMLTLINLSPATVRAIGQQTQLPVLLQNITAYEKIYNFILQRMGLTLQQPINFIGNDVRTTNVSQIIDTYLNSIRQVAISTYNYFLTKSPQTPSSTIESKWTKELLWIDRLFFDRHYEEELVNMGFNQYDILEFRNYFINQLYDTIKKYTIYNRLYTIQNTLNDIDFYIQKIDNNAKRIGTNQDLWTTLKSKLLSAKKVLENIQNQCPYIDKDIYLACLISYAQRLKSFFALSVYFSDRLKNSSPEIIDYHKAVDALITTYADIGFLITILEEEQKNNDIFCFLGAEHCRKLSGYLKQLGYQEIYYFFHDPLTEEELKMLFLMFFNTLYYTKH